MAMRLSVSLSFLIPSVWCLDNGVGRTPALGWSSWNYFERNINETLILEIADGMVSSGLRDAGYTYVNLDAGVWSFNRTAAGELQADSEKFPSGIASLASKLHSMKLKLGLYMNLGSDLATCDRIGSHGIGSHGHYEQDAGTLAKVGCDFIKVDYCGAPGNPGHFVPRIPEQLGAWQQLRDALNATGRPIYSYFCPRSFSGSLVPPDPDTQSCFPNTRCVVDGPPHVWPAETRRSLANSILTEYSNSKDIWSSFLSNLDAVLDLRPQPDTSGPGFFSDADMLQTCNFGGGATPHDPHGMTQDEYAAQFAIWATLGSMMVISADPRTLQQTYPNCLALLTNAEILAVSQDPAANVPRVVFKHNATVPGPSRRRNPYPVTAQGFSRRLHDGSVALVLLNRDDVHLAAATLGATWAELGLPTGETCAIRDLLAKSDLSPAIGKFTAVVKAHTARFVKISCKTNAFVV